MNLVTVPTCIYTIIISTVKDYYVVHPDKRTVYFFDEPILQ